MPYDEATASRVRASLACYDNITERTLMGGRCFMHGGSMCCSVSGKGGLLVRVAPNDYTAVLARAHVAPMTMGKRTMRGFVRVSSEGYRTEKALAQWLALGVVAASAHKPKTPKHASKAAKRITSKNATPAKALARPR